MKYAIALLIVLCSLSTYAHKETFPATLSGKVVDGQTGEPLIGARIAVDGHYYQVFTKPDGTFEIDVPVTEKSVIVVEMISYEDVTLPVSNLLNAQTISLVSI
jgi:iron complex outermembrane recepter protein